MKDKKGLVSVLWPPRVVDGDSVLTFVFTLIVAVVPGSHHGASLMVKM